MTDMSVDAHVVLVESYNSSDKEKVLANIVKVSAELTQQGNKQQVLIYCPLGTAIEMHKTLKMSMNCHILTYSETAFLKVSQRTAAFQSPQGFRKAA